MFSKEEHFMMRKSGLILTASLICAQMALAQTYKAPFTDLPGTIPLQSQRQAAADLQYQGRELQPDEARELANK